jgi:mannose/fructose/N-acetylgalactosamine-specific phosphotransferase system component IIB
MNRLRTSSLFISAALPVILCGFAGIASAKSEIKGAAILDNACGKVAVKQMGLVHAGNMEEANKLSTKEMQDQWKAMPAKDRTMMSGMMKEMSQTETQYAADIKANGVLVVDDKAATLTVKKTTKDKNGTSTETITQNFKVDGSQCLISR